VAKLNLGCGSKIEDKAVNVDKYSAVGIDVVHDLDVIPYPFESASFDEVILDNVLEHLEKPIDVLDEIYRLLKVGGTTKIVVPYFRSLWSYVDPTHKSWYTVHSFDYAVKGTETSKKYMYTKSLYERVCIQFNDGIQTAKLKRPVCAIANRWPRFYEIYLSSFIALEQLTIVLRKVD